MPKFVLYEVYSRARVVEADSIETAYSDCGPDCKELHQGFGLNLGNWHVVPVADETPVTEFVRSDD